MSTLRCPHCNLTNWATAVSCKRCGNILQEGGNVETVNPSPTVVQTPPTQFGVQNQNPTNTQTFPDFGSNNYQSTGYRSENNYSANPYRNDRPQNQKIKLAVVSLVTGILGFPFISAILAGIVAAVLGAIFGGFGAVVGLLVVLAFIPTSLITGIVALVKAKRYPLEYGGKGLAIAGVAISSVSILVFPIIAAIAIPNLLAARRSANEGSAISSIRTIHAAEMTYFVSTGAGKYGELSQLSQSQLIDTTLASGQKSGYKFVITKTDATSMHPAGFEVIAVPITSNGFNSTGTRSFYINEEGIIRYSSKSGVPANEKDPALENLSQREESRYDTKPTGLSTAKPSANDASAISTLRVLHGAQVTYQATKGAGNFGHLHELSQAQMISADLASGQKSGYHFVLRKTNSSGSEPASFSVSAVPINSNGAASTGTKTYYVDHTGVIRSAERVGEPAGSTDPAIDN